MSPAATTLVMKINLIKKSFSKAEILVADYIVENPQEVIHLSVSELADRCGVSESTVIRTCRKIGSDGYQDLKVSLAQDIVTPMQAINEEIHENDSDSVKVAKVFQSSINTLQFTLDTLKAETVVQAAQAIENAYRVVIFGLGNSDAIALDLQHKLLRLGLDAVAYTDSHLQIISSVFLGRGDVLFAVSHSGSSKNIVETARRAKDNGATVISLTNTGPSPLYKIADIRLCTASTETKYRILALSSRVAQITIINSIYTLIATSKTQYTDGFRKLEKALSQTKY